MYDFVSIDFETANGTRGSACSVALVAVRDFKIVSSCHYLIQPKELYFAKKNIQIHGITEKMVENEETFDLVWKKIAHYFDGEIIIAHNSEFDMSVLRTCMELYNITPPDFNYFDTLDFVKIAAKELDSYKLDSVCEYFDIDFNHHHDAFADSTACAHVLVCCMQLLDQSSITNLFRDYSYLKKSFSDVLPSTKQLAFPTKNNIRLSDICAATISFDKKHPLYHKTVVFTGDISLDRKDAMQRVVDVGGFISNAVNKRTNFIVQGVQNKRLVKEDGLSSKERKAYDLINQGVPIKIINENEFLALLEEE